MLDYLNSVDEGFISKESNKKSFNQLFFGPKVDEPIIWSDKVGTLNNFFKQLENTGIIKDAGKGKWKLIWNSFLSEETRQRFLLDSVRKYDNMWNSKWTLQDLTNKLNNHTYE